MVLPRRVAGSSSTAKSLYGTRRRVRMEECTVIRELSQLLHSGERFTTVWIQYDVGRIGNVVASLVIWDENGSQLKDPHTYTAGRRRIQREGLLSFLGNTVTGNESVED